MFYGSFKDIKYFSFEGKRQICVKILRNIGYKDTERTARMFSLSIDQVKPGMKLAEAVHNLNGTKLLDKDQVLDEKLIISLRNSGAKRLWVTDDGNNFLREHGPQRIFNEALLVLHDVQNCVIEGKHFNVQKVDEIATELVEQIIFNELPFAEMVRMKLTENNVLEHMIDVCLLSIMTAKALGMDKFDMRTLGVAALLHDVGKMLISQDILDKPGKLSDHEMKQMKKHPLISYDIISGIEGIHKNVLNVALQHHERLDGSGYPHGIKDKQICEFARIISIADIYTAIIREKSYRPRLPIYEAGELLWALSGREIDRRLTSVFLRSVVAFPLRSVVKLNNGMVGKVVYQNSEFPTRPIVSVDGVMVDLSELPTIFVDDVIAYEYD